LIQKANASERFEDYYHAALLWKKALNTANESPHCKLNTEQAQAKLHKYQYDITYKTELYLADSLDTTVPEKAFEHLINAENIRINKADKLKSSKTPSLLDILIRYNSPELNILGINYFNNKSQSEEAYKLMKLSLESHQEVDKELISKTAHLLAIDDMYKSNSSSNMAEKRFGTKKELQTFKKAYIRASKK
jgi:hypothetical protein